VVCRGDVVLSDEEVSERGVFLEVIEENPSVKFNSAFEENERYRTSFGEWGSNRV